MYPFYDSSFIILIPALIVSLWAQSKVSSTYRKYESIRSIKGYTGADAARVLLNSFGLTDVSIEITGGKLSDHYDPRTRKMVLSYNVYHGNSLAAIGVAAHETGHAIQHAEHYGPLVLRNGIVPLVNFSSNVSWVLFIIGFIINSSGLISLGILLFSAVVVFQIVTLPVEFNASRRALLLLEDKGILYGDEVDGAKKVLSAAAMTYVAAALTAALQLIRLILISGRRNE